MINSAFIRFFALLVVFGFWFHPAQTVANPDARLLEQILTGLDKKYSGQSFSADFVQLSRLAALEITERAAGKAFFSHPGKMRWEYETPDVHQVITDGKTVWIYKPDDSQVIRSDAVRLFGSGAGAAFLSDFSIIRDQFDITLKEATDTAVQISMVNRQKDPDLSSIVLTIDRQSHEIREVVTYNVYDDTTRFNFSHIRFDSLDDSLFEFTPPEKTDVIYMDE